MEDILKALVSSRQQGNSTQGGPDLAGIANLAGSLLGGAQGSGQQAGGVSGVMGALESVMGGQASAGDPIMAMLQPFVAPLAKKANIPPDVAMIVVSFVAHQLLSHHPSSGRDSSHFNFDELMGQISSGNIDPNLLRSSGMVKLLAQKTGLDEATAEKSLQSGFSLVGKGAAALMAKKK
jgi:hypothetical protein